MDELEEIAAKVTEILKLRGMAREVAILSAARFELRDRDPQYGKMTLLLKIVPRLYVAISDDERLDCERSIARTLRECDLDRLEGECWIDDTDILPDPEARPDWRTDASQWLRGEGINNQGRVRSDNLPSRQCDGLLFRSGPEIALYKAFKDLGVTFAPLPVFLRGGEAYQRIEPDFVLFEEGSILVVEVDGDTVHTETPAEADKRTRIFKQQGAFIEHVPASECDSLSKARSCAQRLLKDFAQWRRRRT